MEDLLEWAGSGALFLLSFFPYPPDQDHCPQHQSQPEALLPDVDQVMGDEDFQGGGGELAEGGGQEIIPEPEAGESAEYVDRAGGDEGEETGREDREKLPISGPVVQGADPAPIRGFLACAGPVSFA